MLSQVASLIPAYSSILQLDVSNPSTRLSMSLGKFYEDLLGFFQGITHVFSQKSGSKNANDIGHSPRLILVKSSGGHLLSSVNFYGSLSTFASGISWNDLSFIERFCSWNSIFCSSRRRIHSFKHGQRKRLSTQRSRLRRDNTLSLLRKRN